MRRKDAAVVFACASLLLGYPNADFAEDLVAVGRALDRLPHCRAKNHLCLTYQWMSGMSMVEAAANYVDTFDLHKHNSLHLTFYRYGDTRERGMALSCLAESYRNVGFLLDDGELPDFLPALLELASVASEGAEVLGEYRFALELLRDGLEKEDNLFRGAIASVLEALGTTSRRDHVIIQRYRSEGPPSERVGLETFVPPYTLGQKEVII